MRTLMLLTAASLTALAVLSPAVVANHGYHVEYVSTIGVARCSYHATVFDEDPLWACAVTPVESEPESCLARGTVEKGLVGDCLRVTGTGHWHTCCDETTVDVHEVEITIRAVTGDATAWVRDTEV